MRTTLAVVGLGWRHARRDRLGLLFNFLVPVLVASVLVGIYSSGERVVVGLHDAGEDGVGDALTGRLERTDLLEVQRFDDRRSLEEAVRRREVTGGVVVPVGAGASESVGTIHLLGPPGIESPSGVRAVVESAVAETAASLEVERSLRRAGASDSAVAAALRSLEPAAPEPAAGGGQTRADRLRTAVATALVGTMVMFIFLNTMAASSWLVALRDLGALARLRSTRASSWSISLGLGGALASFALAQAVLVLVVGRFVFGFSWTGWADVVVVTVVVTLTAGATGVLVGTLLPSPDAGATIAGPLGFLLAMLGGCLWSLEIVGPALRRLGHLTPHAWAIEAFRATGVEDRGLAAVVTPILVLLGFTLAMLLVGGRRLWRLTTQG